MLRFFSLPRINDISTDLIDPPAFSPDSDRPCAGVTYPESFKDKVRNGYPDVTSLTLDLDIGDAWERAVAQAHDMYRWEVVRTDADTHTLEAVATTAVLRFKDDVVIRLRDDPAGTRVDMRSRSRLGKHDLGANADRIRAYFARLR